MKKLLVTLPDHDDATFYIFHWSKPILEEAERRGVKVLKLEGEKANRKTFFDFLNSHNPSFLILNGHGDEKTVYGYNDEKVIGEGDEKVLRGKIIYTIACDAAKSFGKSVIEKGGKCFIGYNRKFTFCVDETKMARPLEDGKAASFYEKIY
jgi:hypothetical protein